MKMPYCRATVAAMIVVAGIVFCLPAHASSFSVGGSGNTFTVSRSGAGTNSAETVHYRAVGLSAYAGQNFTSKSGTLTFAPGQTSTNVTVSTRTPSSNAYKFQSGTTRAYRFELLDAGGFRLDGKDRTITAGTSVSTNGAFNIKNVTIQSAEYTADDDGYDKNGYKSVSSNAYFSAAAPKAYFQHVGAQLRMMLDLQAKENDDGYQYLQFLVNETVNCDDRKNCNDGDPGNISLSRYMAGFEIKSGSKDDSYKLYSFPVTNASNNAGAVDPWGYGNKYPLDKQKFNSGCRATDGRIVIPLDFTSLVLRLNASGSSGSDEWAAKSVVARIQAVDSALPTLLDATVSPGPYHRGNTVTVSLAFSEIVVPKPSSGFFLNTSWGMLGYEGGTCGNVLTFSGKIDDGTTDNTPLSITGFFGLTSINDLAGNAFGGSVSRSINVSVAPSVDYAIAYDLAGGTLPPNEDPNPDVYNYDSDIILTDPVRPGYTFAGWSGTGISGTRPTVSIYHSHGDRAYTAHWTLATYTITYANATNGVGGVVNANPTSYTIEDGTVSLADPTRTNYFFCGWYENPGFTGAPVSSFSAADLGDRTFYAKWTTLPPVPYIDENGVEQQCRAYTVITNAAGNVAYGERGAEAWYVVTNDVTISGRLYFDDDYAHLILCDGATLTVTNENGEAIKARVLTIYGQTNGTGAIVATGIGQFHFYFSGIDTDFVIINGGIVTATGSDYGIYTGFVTINGGSVTATGGYDGIYVDYDYASVTINGGSVTATGGEYGIYVRNGSITLGWTNPTDSIYASSYDTRNCIYLAKKFIDDDGNIYEDDADPSDLAGKTLRPLKLAISYLDANGDTQHCTDYIVLTNVAGNVEFGESGAENWYVVTNDVTISGKLWFLSFYSHLILCDGATLTVTNRNGNAIDTIGNLTIYGQSNGTGALVANGSLYGINAISSFTMNGGSVTAAGTDEYGAGIRTIGPVTINDGSVTANGGEYGIYASGGSIIINGGTVTATATGDYDNGGIYANSGGITLGWTNPSDSIYASDYYAGKGINLAKKFIDDDGNIYEGAVSHADLASKTLRPYIPHIPYIDVDGVERQCYAFTVLTNATGDVTYGEYDAEAWYVVTNDVNISGNLYFVEDTAHLILCDGATLTVTNENGAAIEAGDLAIYGQTNGTGTIVANGSTYGINAFIGVIINGGSVTATGNSYGINAGYVIINGGTLTATGNNNGINAGYVIINGGTLTATGSNNGINAFRRDIVINGGTVTATATNSDSYGIVTVGPVVINGGTVTAIGGLYGIFGSGSITLGWTNPTDSIYASGYNRNVTVNGAFTDGFGGIYKGTQTQSALAGKTLRPFVTTPTYPAYLAEADNNVTNNYDAWAARYGYDALGANETAYLLGVAPGAVTNGVAALKIVEMGVTNVPMNECGDYEYMARMMGYSGDTLSFRQLVLASDVAPLKKGFYDALTICNGYLVLRIGTDLSAPKGEWLETGWPARVMDDGRAEITCPDMILDAYRKRVATSTGKPCPALFLSVSIEPRKSDSTAISDMILEIINSNGSGWSP